MRALVIAMALAVAGCTGAGLRPDDAGAIRVAWHKVDAARVGLVCVGLQTSRAAAWLTRMRINVGGCYQLRGDVCHIYAPDDSRALGHELRHCFDGQWHGDTLDAS